LARQLLVFMALAASAAHAWADECVDPYKRTILSLNKAFKVEFTPQKRDCSDDNCSDDPKTTGELKGNPKAPTLTLFRLGPGKKWVQKWSTLLLDRYEPMGMVVSDDGRHVILADRWCDSGLGNDVLVLLGPDGAKLQAWSLAQILPAEYIAALIQTSFNIHWRGAITFEPSAHGFDFQIAVPDGEYFGGGMRFVDLVLDPDVRTFAPRNPVAWAEARNVGKARAESICLERKWRLRRAAVPLSAPIRSDRKTWLNFAMELEKRVVFPKLETFGWKQRLFLTAPDDASYQDDLKKFRRVLTMTRAEVPGDFYLVSPDLKNAHSILKTFLAGEKAKNLGNDRFVIVGDPPTASEVMATIGDYGGQQVRIIALREAVPPAADRKDYDWEGQRACAAIAENTAETPSR
jgi:hypothetical protein